MERTTYGIRVICVNCGHQTTIYFPKGERVSDRLKYTCCNNCDTKSLESQTWKGRP